MRHIALASTLVLALSAIQPALAGEQDDAALEKAVEAHNADVDSGKDELVCVKEAQTGSRIKKTVCRTRRAIENEEEAAKQYVNKPRLSPVAPKE